jgi:ketosteroid isomerase-like protein
MATRAKDVEKELLELEKKYWQAIKEKDVDTAMRLTDDPCIVTGAQGVGRMARKDLGAMMNSASYTLREFEVKDDVQVRLLNDDVAVLAYQVHEELTVDGKPVTLDAADSSTWVRRDGRWLCALHTEAIAGDPFGRDRHAAR